MVARTRASGDRVFTVGVGHAVSAAFLEILAEDTGGACELVAPAEDERSDGFPALRKVPHMLAAGWGGSSGHMYACRKAPDIAPDLDMLVAPSRPDRFESVCERYDARFEDTWDLVEGDTSISIDVACECIEKQLIAGGSVVESMLSIDTLRDCGIPEDYLETLESHVEAGHPEDAVVATFVHALLYHRVKGPGATAALQALRRWAGGRLPVAIHSELVQRARRALAEE